MTEFVDFPTHEPKGHNDPVIAVARTVLRQPFARRTHRELLWSFFSLATGAAWWALLTVSLTVGNVFALVVFTGLLVVGVATGWAVRIAGCYLRPARHLLGVEVAVPVAIRRSAVGNLRDPHDWRAAVYLVIRLPIALLHLYVLLWWVGFANMAYPFLWGAFRNHPAGSKLSQWVALTPLGWLHITTLAGTFVAFAAGVTMVLAAPWVTHGVAVLERSLFVVLLGSGQLAERVRELELSRAHVVNDASATLRRIERDLHDGPQAQIATLAMKLGQASEKLDRHGEMAFNPAHARELVDAAQLHATAALAELRTIIQSVHPPALDVGLRAALSTLAARNAVPTTLRLHDDLASVMAAPAIETIAYFSVAELLANVARHSGATHALVDVGVHDGWLQLAVTDDGTGGANLDHGSGLSGLTDRVATVNGRLHVSSPQGGPTVVVVQLPVLAPRDVSCGS